MWVSMCLTCGQYAYPAPLACSACHGRDLDWAQEPEATVEQVTCSPQDTFQLATVITGHGVRMIARVPTATARGQRLPLVEEHELSGAYVPRDPMAPRG